jgi:hypothetical protein
MKLCNTCTEANRCEFPENFRELEFRHTGNCRNYRPNIKAILELEEQPVPVESVILLDEQGNKLLTDWEDL